MNSLVIGSGFGGIAAALRLKVDGILARAREAVDEDERAALCGAGQRLHLADGRYSIYHECRNWAQSILGIDTEL